MAVKAFDKAVSYISYTLNMTQDLLHNSSSSCNPESGPQLSQCGPDPTMHDSHVSPADEQESEMVFLVEEDGMDCEQWKICVLE